MEYNEKLLMDLLNTNWELPLKCFSQEKGAGKLAFRRGAYQRRGEDQQYLLRPDPMTLSTRVATTSRPLPLGF